MLSITKIKSAATSKAGGGYSSYLDHLDDGAAFDEYARTHELGGPLPFWFGSSLQELGLMGTCRPDEVKNLATGLHPKAGTPLVLGAGQAHVMGADLTFSCPKDVSVLFAGADAKTQADIVRAMHGSVREALGYAQSIAITRHGKGGAIKQLARSVVASVYTHFASRALDPQLHAHAFLFNVGQRQDGSWSALEHRAQFENKMATGILFRVELAHRLKALGFAIEPQDGLFTIGGINQHQREALSKRSQELNEALKKAGASDSEASKDQAAKATRGRKDEPPLPELLEKFSADAKALGITSSVVAGLRTAHTPEPPVPFALDHKALLDELMEHTSVITRQELLRAICTKALGHWSASECLQELERLVKSPLLVHLGATDTLTEVFTARSMKELESDISLKVQGGRNHHAHRIDAAKVDVAFDELQRVLSEKIGVSVDLKEQREAAHHVCTHTGQHAFVEGWAGTGKTTMLKAIGELYKQEGFSLVGTALSASAALNLQQETGIASNTLAGLLLALQEGRMKLSARDVVVLDEAGLVGSKEFALIQQHVVKAEAKLIAVGDPKQLQPIEAGGIFKSLMKLHGAAQVSQIQRQKTDIAPLLKYLASSSAKNISLTNKERAKAIWSLPEEARIRAVEDLAKVDPKVHMALERWRTRYDHKWLRVAVEKFAKGEALGALNLMEEHGCLHLISDAKTTKEALISRWAEHKADLSTKTIIAATRTDVRALNDLARRRLISDGKVADSQGIETTITLRDETQETRRFAPGDRIVFTQNDRTHQTVNGLQGTIERIDHKADGPHLVVALDVKGPGGQSTLSLPARFGRFDHAYCLTNHKAQGKTVEASFVYVDPRYSGREWSYVAASRSKFSTELFVDQSALHPVDLEAHHPDQEASSALEELGRRMSRSSAKGTSLDYEETPSPTATDIRLQGVLKKTEELLERVLRFTTSLISDTPEPERVKKAQGKAPEQELQP